MTKSLLRVANIFLITSFIVTAMKSCGDKKKRGRVMCFASDRPESRTVAAITEQIYQQLSKYTCKCFLCLLLESIYSFPHKKLYKISKIHVVIVEKPGVAVVAEVSPSKLR